MNYRQKVLATWDPTLTDEERYLIAFADLGIYSSNCEDLAYAVVNHGDIMDIKELTENLTKVRYNLECILILYGISMQELESMQEVK
jgi:hypothetical protein